MVILAGRLMGDAEAPRHVVWDSEPCDKCKEYMEKGVICISIKNGETNHNNPYRTGGWCVITAEAVTRMPMDDMLKKDILNKRMMFVEDVVWDSLGFPRGEISEVKEGA